MEWVCILENVYTACTCRFGPVIVHFPRSLQIYLQLRRFQLHNEACSEGFTEKVLRQQGEYGDAESKPRPHFKSKSVAGLEKGS